ncbi:MAG: hypothetical protein AAF266_07580 [Planctomycetota bacterium]
MKSLASRFAQLLIALLGLLVSLDLRAATLVASNGFESPAFTAGDLNGQQDWIALFQGNTASSASVQSDVVRSGSSALRVDRASQSNGFWVNPQGGAPTGRFVTIEWDMLVQQSSTTGFGPFFGVEAYDSSNNGSLRFGSLGVDARTGDVLMTDRLSGLVETPVDVTFGTWSRFRMEIDLEGGEYAAYLNDTPVAATEFEFAGASTFTDADIVAIAASFDTASQQATGTAFFDNFVVTDGIRGDYNSDGLIDAADYAVWRDQENQTGFSLAADGDANGVVDNADYVIWTENYGESNALSMSAVTVPEPMALSVSLVSLLGSALARRHVG